MRGLLKEDQESNTRFLMSVSHDLKTPLSTIDGYLDALIDGFADDDKSRAKFYQTMKDKSEILTERIAGLIGYARMSTGEWIEKLGPVHAGTFFTRFIKGYQAEAELKGYQLSLSPLPDLDFNIIMDENLAYRALENLVQNAIKYSDERKIISFGIVRNRDALLIQVGNRGTGISPENHEAVFLPFFRESTGRNEAGSGLGLSTVKHIAESHGWSVSLSSEPGEYTEFTICIPLPSSEPQDHYRD